MQELHNQVEAELEGGYVLRCSYCETVQGIVRYTSTNWSVGDAVAYDASAPADGRCVRCKRHALIVILAPVVETVPLVEGFSKIPEE